ncbi:MAG: hypothetical protein HY721_33945, partial [Planctomycetes bacterium]|nr:hypothetical protein [Planctomycetota bacterium]
MCETCVAAHAPPPLETRLEATAPAGSSPGNPPSISAGELHRICLRTFRLGNSARLKFLRALHALSQGGLYRLLGYSSIQQYAEKHFGYERSEVYEHLRVARGLDALPLSEQAFEAGRLSWSSLKELTRVATGETEAEWIAFAEGEGLRRLKLEVQDALEKRRSRPRKGRWGLPGVPVTVSFTLKPEEHELLRKALRRSAEELRGALGGEEVKPHEALLYLARRALEGSAAGGGAGRQGAAGKERAIYQVLYHLCPDCRQARVLTEDGPVEVPSEVVERVEGDAERESLEPELAPPNP